MSDLLPKTTQIFAHHLKSFDIIESLIASVSLRVEAEENYQRALVKSFQKVNEIQTTHPLYSKIMKSFKSLTSERIHQIHFFKEQISKESQTLKLAIQDIEVQMKNQLNDVKNLQKDLRSAFDKMSKNKLSIEQKMRELDQKFILNEISLIHKQNKNIRIASENIIKEQDELIKVFDGFAHEVRVEIKRFQAASREKQMKISDYDIKIQEEFVDFIKRFNVHEISLIRNIQYDIDSMLKKTDIFNYQNTTEFKEKLSLKALENINLNISNPYFRVKKQILKSDQTLKMPEKMEEIDKKIIDQLKSQLEQKKESQKKLQEFKEDYFGKKHIFYEYIQSYRKQNKFKFQEDVFTQVSHVFRQILRNAYANEDFEGMKKIIMFANSYHCGKHSEYKGKRTIFEELKEEHFLCELSFWKYYLYFSIKQTVSQCLKIVEDKEIHMKNGVYSTLLSNSLTMIQCGIEKHNIKNLIAKLAKSYGGLTEIQISQLLKVIETGFQTYQKQRKKDQEEKIKQRSKVN